MTPLRIHNLPCGYLIRFENGTAYLKDKSGEYQMPEQWIREWHQSGVVTGDIPERVRWAQLDLFGYNTDNL